MNLHHAAFIEPSARRPFMAALAFWLAQCVGLSAVLAVQVQHEGLAFLQSAEGQVAVREFLRMSLLAPGFLIPMFMIWWPRLAVAICALFGLIEVALALGVLLFGSSALHVLVSLGSAALFGAATLLANRSRVAPIRANAGVSSNPSIEATSQSPLRALWAAPHVER